MSNTTTALNSEALIMPITDTELYLDMNPSIEENELVIIVFYGTIAMGKSTFKKKMEKKAEEKEYSFHTLSKDDCCVRVIKEYVQTHPEKEGSEELFIETMEDSAELFDKEIKRIIEKDIKPGKSIFLIDHGRMDSYQLKYLSQKNLKSGFDVKLIAIYPENPEPFYYTQDKFVPFSAQLIANICDRVVKRMFHETIVYVSKRRVHLALSYIMTYEGIRDFEESFKNDARWEKMIPIPFHKEKKAKCYELDHLVEKIRYTMSHTEIFDYQKSQKNDKAQELVNLLNDENFYNKLGNFIEFASEEQWNGKIDEIFKVFN